MARWWYSRLPLPERFSHFILKTDSCWLWTGAKYGRGYGHFSINGRSKIASRVAWELWRGPIPSGMCVLHRCDNPPCVNPDHLFLGTIQDNHDDMWRKDRGMPASGDKHWSRKHPESVARGNHHGRRKLNADDVVLIRKERVAGLTLREMEAKWGIRQSTLSRICNGLLWAHL